MSWMRTVKTIKLVSDDDALDSMVGESILQKV